jgi:hypothetical protein
VKSSPGSVRRARVVALSLAAFLLFPSLVLPALAQTPSAPTDLTPGVNPASLGRGLVIPLRRVPNDIAISLDGRLDEDVWRQLTPIEGMWVVEPETLAPALYNSRIHIFYNDAGIYVGMDLEQPAGTRVRRITGRDNRNESRDRITFTLDTSGEGNYGYWVSLALGDSKLDGTLLPERQYNSQWDGAWDGATAETPDGWSAEFFVPWGQLAMPAREGTRYIGFYSERVVAHLNQNWGWPGIARTDPVFISQYPRLQLEEVNPRQQWSIFPSYAMTYDDIEGNLKHRAGADVFWRPSSNFQLSATLNPDFGSAEADDVVVNLTANETFFPEKRLFFLEGQEIFNTTPRAGGNASRRFNIINTRRIGGRPRPPALPPGVTLPARERIQTADLMGAAKVTGQLGSFRYGVLAASEDETRFRAGGQRYLQDGRDFGAFRLLYEDSGGGAAYRGLGYIGSLVAHPDADAQVHAVDYHYLTQGGRWSIDGQLITSRIDGREDGYGTYADIVFSPQPGFRHTLHLTYMDESVDVNHLGYQERNNAWESAYRFEWTLTGLKRVRDMRLNTLLSYQENLAGERTQAELSTRANITLNNLDRVELGLQHFGKRYDDRNSFGNGSFATRARSDLGVGYTTNPARPVSLEAGYGFSQEQVSGNGHSLALGISWRPMANLNFSARTSLEERDAWLLHRGSRNFTAFESRQWNGNLRMEYYLTAKQQLTAGLQWVGIRAAGDRFFTLPAESLTRPRDLVALDGPPVTAGDFSLAQMNFQLRYRWEIAPLSDLFIVYTRNGNERMALIDFDEQFRRTWGEPLVSQVVVKLRYRFGT